jgi:hypothetical protein
MSAGPFKESAAGCADGESFVPVGYIDAAMLVASTGDRESAQLTLLS